MKEYRLKENEYLKPSIVAELFKEKNNCIIISKTNTGKTEACLKAAQESGYSVVFAVDTKILADQLSAKYGIPVYYAGKDFPLGNCITLHYHIGLFKSKSTILFVDEFHSIIKDYGYKKEQIDNMISDFTEFKQVIGLTGTPLASMEGFEEFYVILEREERVINLLNYPNNYMDELIYQVLSNKDKIHYISIFDKSHEADAIRATLEVSGIKKEQIANINSETKSTKAFRDIVTICKTNGIKVVITTFTQGFNIEGNGYMLHIIPKEKAQHSLADIEQVVNRFRDETPLINLYWNHKLNYKTEYCGIKQFEIEFKEANELITKYLVAFAIKGSNTLDEMQSSMVQSHIDAKAVLNVTMYCKPNLIGIHYNVYKKQTNEMYLDLDYFKELLKLYKYKTNVIEPSEYLVETQTDKTNERKAEIHKCKLDIQKEHLLEIHNGDISTSSFSDLSMKYYKLCKYYSKDEVYRKLSEILLDRKKWNKECSLLKVKHSKDFASIALKSEVYSTFTEKQYTNQSVFDLLNKIHKKLSLPCVPSLTKASHIVDMYFETKPCKINNGIGVRVNGKIIISKSAA